MNRLYDKFAFVIIMANLIQILTTLENMSSVYLDTNIDQNSLVHSNATASQLCCFGFPWTNICMTWRTTNTSRARCSILREWFSTAWWEPFLSLSASDLLCYFTTTQFYMLFRFKIQRCGGEFIDFIYHALRHSWRHVFWYYLWYGCYSVNIMFTIFFAIGWCRLD